MFWLLNLLPIRSFLRLLYLRLSLWLLHLRLFLRLLNLGLSFRPLNPRLSFRFLNFRFSLWLLSLRLYLRLLYLRLSLWLLDLRLSLRLLNFRSSLLLLILRPLLLLNLRSLRLLHLRLSLRLLNFELLTVFAVAQLQVASVVVAPEAVSVDIAVAFVVLVLASVVVVEADSSGRPRFLAFPNADHFASFSSSVEVVGEESVHSPIGAHTNYGLCSILSSLDLHHNRNLGHCYNNPNPGYNTVIDTNGLPMGATTNHPRKTSLYLYQEQRKHHLYRASRPHPEVPQMRSMVVRSSFHLHFGLHNLVRQGCSSPGETGIAVWQLFLISRIFFMVSSLFYPGVFKLTPLWNNFLLQHMVYKGHKKLVWLPQPPCLLQGL